MTAAASDDDTLPPDDIGTEKHALALIAAGSHTPPYGIPSSIVDRISDKVASKVASQILTGGGGGGGGDDAPPPGPVKTFLGETRKGWAAWVAKGLVVVCASMFAWYTYVNDAIESRPTYSETAKSHTKLEKLVHESHLKLEKLVGGQASHLAELRNIQIRQTVIIEAHEKSIDQVETTVERHRNRDH
jgi:hypothetical protein